jgi:hypothetical protein
MPIAVAKPRVRATLGRAMSVTQSHNVVSRPSVQPALGEEVERVSARVIGSRAAALVASPGFTGRVLAVNSQSVYVLDLDDEILWLAPLDSAKHGRCILADYDPAPLAVGMRVDVRGQRLRIGYALEVDLSPASCWRYPQPTPRERLPLDAVEVSCAAACAAVASLPNPRGLGPVIGVLAALTPTPPGDTVAPGDDMVVDHAWPAISAIARACRRGDVPGMLAAGSELIGLGPGLTPSGDDFVGGALFSVQTLGAVYPEVFGLTSAPFQTFLERARPLTNHISFAILSDLARGHGPESLHDFVTSQLRGESGHRSLEAAQRIVEIGHSSGYDLLAGAVTGMLLTEATNRRPGRTVERRDCGVATVEHVGGRQSSRKPWGGIR